MSEDAAKKKRKYLDSDGGKSNNRRKWGVINRRPKRGAPGMLLTCETGRERKCQREGLDILNHYLTTPDTAATSDHDITSINPHQGQEGDTTTTLSLEEELKLLKSKKGSSESSSFGVYETSCRGTVFVLCTLSNCNLIPTIQTEYMLSKKNNTTSEVSKSESQTLSDSSSDHVGNDDGDVSNKTIKSETSGSETGKTNEAPSTSLTSTDPKNNDATQLIQETPPWDPISTVRTIMSDIDNDSNKAAPRSRFVTRMIPIQATCFASPEELQLTCSEVLNNFISRTTKTFAIVFKRRNCSNLNRNLVIKIVGEIMSKQFPDCKVDLDKPDATILVETCGTLCGISVVEKFKDCRKFNLLGADTSAGLSQNGE
jgi:tRNA(Ser,Leu) C12 N-acetylase TAN1